MNQSKVIALGAVCDVNEIRPDGESVSFAVSEFVQFADGTRVTLHDDRGFAMGLGGAAAGGRIAEYLSREQLTEDILNTVLPDDDSDGESHPGHWLAQLASAQGIAVTADELRTVPYDVVFTTETERFFTRR